MRRSVLALVALGLLLGLSAAPAASNANENHNSYFWVVGADGLPSTETTNAPDGSTITMGGHGVLTAGPSNAASGGGT